MNQELQNAMAFYQPEPPGDFRGITGLWLWMWETLQGDFNENPSTGQIVAGALITMIPIVDQIGDVRDLIANCRKIHKDDSDTWAWVALILTLIGLFPTVGSLLKGCLKVVIFYIRKSIFKALKPVPRIDAAALDQSMALLRRHLDNPVVRKTLARMKVHNPYQYLAEKLTEVKDGLTTKALLQQMDQLMQVTRELFDAVVKWGPDSLRKQVQGLWDLMVSVRNKANEGVGKALRPAQDYLDQIINRLRVEGDNAYRARPGNNNHILGQQRDAVELELLRQKKPDWVDKGVKEKFPALEELPSGALDDITKGWPDISASSNHRALVGKFDTFDISMSAAKVTPGERLYRVLDPNSGDNSIHWMREPEFKALQSKSQWRREFAVWKHWNENGEFVIYTVPPGKNLKVWEGRAGTQRFKQEPSYKLEGGRPQIALNPDDLNPKFISRRQQTGWGYDDGVGDAGLDPLKPFLGLPELTHKWHMPATKKEP